MKVYNRRKSGTIKGTNGNELEKVVEDLVMQMVERSNRMDAWQQQSDLGSI